MHGQATLNTQRIRGQIEQTDEARGRVCQEQLAHLDRSVREALQEAPPNRQPGYARQRQPAAAAPAEQAAPAPAEQAARQRRNPKRWNPSTRP